MPFSLTPATAGAWVHDAVEEAAHGVADVVAMLRGIATDPRVPQAAKVEASAALAYLAAGRGRIPSFIPGVGRLDDLAVAAFTLRRLLMAAGEPVLQTHWRGSPRGLEILLAMTGALAAPGGRLRRIAVAGAAVSAVRDQFGPSPAQAQEWSARRRRASARPRSRPGRVINGEVVGRREERR